MPLILLAMLCFQWFGEKRRFGFNSRRLHHIEFRSDSDAARCAATVVSANEHQCFLNETVSVYVWIWRFNPIFCRNDFISSLLFPKTHFGA